MGASSTASHAADTPMLAPEGPASVGVDATPVATSKLLCLFHELEQAIEHGNHGVADWVSTQIGDELDALEDFNRGPGAGIESQP